jgi:hypothetical protein
MRFALEMQESRLKSLREWPVLRHVTERGGEVRRVVSLEGEHGHAVVIMPRAREPGEIGQIVPESVLRSPNILSECASLAGRQSTRSASQRSGGAQSGYSAAMVSHISA